MRLDKFWVSFSFYAYQLVADWPDLFVLKTFHCTTVQPLEDKMYRRLLSDVEVQDLRIQLNQEYSAYERILEGVRLSPGAYTYLAHSICLADAFWFHARVLEGKRDRETVDSVRFFFFQIPVTERHSTVEQSTSTVLFCKEPRQLCLRMISPFSKSLKRQRLCWPRARTSTQI